MSYFLSIFLGTFVLEDLALASSVALISDNKMSLIMAFWACFLGISLGDLGLYVLGFAGASFGLEKRWSFLKKHHQTLAKMRRSQALTSAIVISRLIPGTRLPTYVSAGFLRFPFLKFFWLTLGSVGLWVLTALIAGQSLQYFLMDRWFLILVCLLVILGWIKNIVPQLTDVWLRKALRHTWRRWLYFEFWPPLLFYLPIVPIYIYLWIKHRSPFLPFYASPHLAHGGLIGESKWEFLRHLKPSDPATLDAILIPHDLDFMTSQERIRAAGISYPFIIKPNVGQRGFGVRIVHDDFELTEYLLLSNFDRIVQRLSVLKGEAGIFYVRKPEEQRGQIFSFTDKEFPFVTGDGVTKLGDLILGHERARIIAPVYFSRLQAKLNSIPEKGEHVFLSECGNHCQGAIFKNGQSLITEELTLEIDRLAKQIPDFYFGRFDVRYRDRDSLKMGKNFEIVEINGAGSEATHIWDSEFSLVTAYQVLFRQWSFLFAIGAFQKKAHPDLCRLNIVDFFKIVFDVNRRKTELSISS